MKTIQGLQQGSDAWLAHRRTVHGASDAPAMMGASPYVSRSELIRQRATGIDREIDPATQRLFDKGHAVEPLLRDLAQTLIGEELYPVTGVSDDGCLGCSFDGVTMDERTIFEAKQSNAEKERLAQTGEIPPQDYWQVVHQFAVCESAARCIYIVGDGTEAGSSWVIIARHAVKDDIPKLIAGWKQFDADVAAYAPEPQKAEPVATIVEGFGALSLRVEGRVLASNLDAFRAGAEAFIARLPKPADLQTDQDFADADAAVKACAEAESRIKSAKEAALAQMADVDAVLRTADSISEAIRSARLALDKVVKSEKENRRADLIRAGVDAVREHYSAINATMSGFEIGVPASLTADIGSAIKGLKSLDSIKGKIDAAVANAKIAASQDADRRRQCIALLPDDRALFPDAAALVASKSPDDLRNLIAARVAEHEAKEKARIERERERIRQEELDRIESERKAAEAAQEAQQAAPAPAEPVAAPAVSPAPVAAPARRTQVAKSRPTDREIIDVLTLHFRVHDSKVIEWLLDMDLDQASRDLAA